MRSTHSGADPTFSPGPGDTVAAPDRSAADYLPAAPPGYQLIRPLGHGGMGSVYLAHEEAAERTVAIKFLHAPGSPSAYDRFLVEVRTLAKLDHPNVVRVFAVETNWREPYFTMEYAGGGTLSDLISSNRPLPDPTDAARLILAATAGVAAAHATGIWHRDLKPSNILLSAECGMRNAASKPEERGSGLDSEFRIPNSALTPKVSDFGLAKRTDRDDGLTRTGPIGTPGYMSPEAAEGRFRDVGPASDVYGLGATLYHLLTGRPPFSGPDPIDVIRRVVTDEPERPRAIRPEVPAGLEAVVDRAMEKDPAKRYQTVEGFADDLRRFLAGQKPDAPIRTRVRRAWRWLARNRRRIAAVSALAILATLLVVGTRALSRSSEPTHIEVRPPTDAELVEARRDESRRLIAGGQAVSLLDEDGRPRHHRVWLDSNEPRPLGPGEGTCVFQAFNTGLLELAPNLGIDRYTVSLELQHLQSPFDIPSDEGDTGSVGVYFGHAAARADDGTAAHAFFAVIFKDISKWPTTKPRPGASQVFLATRGEFESARGPVKDITSKFSGLKFTPRATGATDVWRPVVLEVSPAGVRVLWRIDGGWFWEAEMIPFPKWDGKQTGAQYEGLKSSIGKRAPGAEQRLPPWTPGMPFGIYVSKAKVAIRNVTVSPGRERP